jgi:hypothetical protein
VCNAVQYSAVQCSAVQCSAVQCSAVQWRGRRGVCNPPAIDRIAPLLFAEEGGAPWAARGSCRKFTVRAIPCPALPCHAMPSVFNTRWEGRYTPIPSSTCGGPVAFGHLAWLEFLARKYSSSYFGRTHGSTDARKDAL